MSTTIDPRAMRMAIPAVEQAIAVLDGAVGALGGISPPAGLPGGLAARITHAVQGASRDLSAKARALDHFPAELLRRISAAQLADSPALILGGYTIPALKMYANSFSLPAFRWPTAAGRAGRDLFDAFRAGAPYQGVRPTWNDFRGRAAGIHAQTNVPIRGMPRGLALAARYGGKGLTAVNWGLTAYNNVRNPYLTTGQKIGRTGASIATAGGVSIMAGAAAGAMLGSAAGPVGTVIGFGAGVAWTALDQKFGISNKIGDGAAKAGGAVVSGAKAVGGAAKSVGKKALGVIGL
jgi:hypothetical protein